MLTSVTYIRILHMVAAICRHVTVEGATNAGLGGPGALLSSVVDENGKIT